MMKKGVVAIDVLEKIIMESLPGSYATLKIGNEYTEEELRKNFGGGVEFDPNKKESQIKRGGINYDKLRQNGEYLLGLQRVKKGDRTGLILMTAEKIGDKYKILRRLVGWDD